MYPWLPVWEFERLAEELQLPESGYVLFHLTQPPPKRKLSAQEREKLYLDLPHEERHEYVLARREHAFLLRCENITYQKISERLGLSRGHVEVSVKHFARKLAHAMRRTKITIQ